MAKKLAEEAVEVVIDAMNGQNEAVVKESADLMYNLVVLWVAAGIHPKDVWAEMNRRERLFGIAEKLPKRRQRAPFAAPQGRRARTAPAAPASGAEPRAARAQSRPPCAMDIPGLAPLSNPPHAEENVRLVRRGGGQAPCDVDPGHRLVRRKLVLSDSARRHADPDVAGAARPGLLLRDRLHAHVGRRRHPRLRDRLLPLRDRSGCG